MLWIAAAITTSDDYEQFIPTISLLPGAVFLGYVHGQKCYWCSVRLVVASALAANVIWAAYDIIFVNPKSHNMLPFELIATAIFATISAAVGVGVGKLCKIILKR